MDELKLVQGGRTEMELELVEALLTPWDKQRLFVAVDRLKPKGKLSLATPLSKDSGNSKKHGRTIPSC